MFLRRARHRYVRYTVQIVLAGVLLAQHMSAYSVLTHEALIDAAWNEGIKPVLLRRFPRTTEPALRKAHSYAYGGAIIHDMGYYPFGSAFFSDLLHYVRTGDFVEALVSEARDVNEVAFAAGAVAHFTADHFGHGIAVNRSVAMLYPKLARRFGNSVTYEDDHASHIKVEFGFDVAQVAKGHYAPEAYHDFIGFSVSKELLERAFLKTYGLKLGDGLPNVDLGLGTFRFAVSQVIPEMTKAAWSAKKDEIQQSVPGITRQRFIYNISRSSYQSEWGNEYERPGWFARFLGFLFRASPKVGPLRAFGFRAPTPEVEKLFMASFNQALDQYRARLKQLRARGRIELHEENLDTGEPARHGTYALADETHAKLVRKLGQSKDAAVSAELRKRLIAYFADAPSAPAELRAIR